MTQRVNYEPLVKNQQARGEATREKMLAALRAIEQEIKNHGLYPENNGKVTLTEVARRAEVSVVTLRNRHHHHTSDIVQNWLAQLKQHAPTTKPRAQRAAREKIAWYEDALKVINSEALKWRAELAVLSQENEKLPMQIATMKTADDKKVVGIRSRRTTSD